MVDFENKLYESALKNLPEDPNARDTAVGDYILLYRAKSYLLSGRNQQALDSFRLLAKQYPNSSRIHDSLLGQCQAALALKDSASVLEALKSSQAAMSSETLYYKASALDMSGDKEQAIRLYLQIYAGYPASSFAPLAQRRLESLSPGALQGARNYGLRLQRAESLLKSNDNQGARTVLLALGRVSAPDAKSSQKRYLLMAEAEYRRGRTTAALTNLKKITALDPAIHARAIYLEGACRRKLDKEEALVDLRDKALKLYPLSGDTEELCYSTATYYDVNYQQLKSRDAYRVLSNAFPKGRHAETALWKLALLSYSLRRYEEAAIGFWNYIRAYPNPVAAGPAMYWMGRCYQKLGAPEKAHYLYQRTRSLANDSYYGQRAREAEDSIKQTEALADNSVSALDFKLVLSTCDAIRPRPVLLPELNGEGVRVAERARELAAADLPDLALAELQWGVRNYPGNDAVFSFIMSWIYSARDDHNGSISSLRRAFPDYNVRPKDDLPDEAWRLLFPRPYRDIVSTHAAKTSLDANLLLGIMRQESAFNEKAQSKANARGLMQILPSTGRRLARQAKIPRYSTRSLFQAETNITLGTRFFASLLEQFGKTELALAAYNAGPGRVKRWLQEYGGEDMAEFVEQIPFSETRGYVKQVLSNKAHYDLLDSYFGDRASKEY